MQTFDIEKKRRVLTSEVGYEFFLQHSFEEFRQSGALASAADGFLGQGIYCLLVGFAEPAQLLFAKTKEWIKYALEHGEKKSYVGTLYNLALSNWLLTGREEPEWLSKAVTRYDEFFVANPSLVKTNVSLALHQYIDARAYQRAIELFESMPHLKVPTEAKNLPRSEAQLCYAIAKCCLHESFTMEEIRLAAGKFLDRNVDRFLANGWAIQVATWSKIAYWNLNPQPPTPTEVVLKCLEHCKK